MDLLRTRSVKMGDSHLTSSGRADQRRRSLPKVPAFTPPKTSRRQRRYDDDDDSSPEYSPCRSFLKIIKPCVNYAFVGPTFWLTQEPYSIKSNPFTISMLVMKESIQLAKQLKLGATSNEAVLVAGGKENT